MKTIHNKRGRRKPLYRVISDHKTKLNGQDEPETVKITLNNGFHTMDGKLKAGWSVGSLNTETQVYSKFTEAAKHFEELTGEKPPAPEFTPNLQGVTNA